MFRIAIDGTASAGKGSIAKGVAKALNLPYVDTGAMYRSIALIVTESGKDCRSSQDVISCLTDVEFDFTWDEEHLLVWLNGREVTALIRTEEMGGYASQVSVIPEVRARLSEMQKAYAASTSLVMDGRDIGTVIIPDAELKVFVDADIQIRGERRYQELLRRGQNAVLSEVVEDLKDRDHRDRTRPVAPLKMADDALLLDTSHLNINQGIQRILAWHSERIR